MTGPSSNHAQYDRRGRKKSPLMKKIQSGKMEMQENTAQNSKPGLLLPGEIRQAFHAGFLHEDRCRRWILERLHPEGATCPACGQELKGKLRERYWENGRIECSGCGKWFTALTGTIFQGTRMNFCEIMLLGFLLGLNQSTSMIAKIIMSDEKTIRLWRNKLINQEIHDRR